MTQSEEQALRVIALKMARDINPDSYGQNQTWGIQSVKIAPSAATILTTAETIYQWLLNGA